MRVNRVLVVGAAVLALTVATAGDATAAAPSGGPSVSFHFANNRITAGHQPRVVYGSSGLPATARLVLQRWSRVAGEWRRATRLPGLSGRDTAPAVAMGRYRYRVVAKRAGHRLAVSPTRRLWAYGRIPLSTLCASPEVTLGAGSECAAGLGSAQVGSRLFSYQAALRASSAPVGDAMTAAKSTCRNLRLEMVVDPAQDPAGTTTVGVSFIQEGSDVIVVRLVRSTTVSDMVEFLMPGASWSISTGLERPATGITRVLVAGTASCWSPSGA